MTRYVHYVESQASLFTSPWLKLYRDGLVRGLTECGVVVEYGFTPRRQHVIVESPPDVPILRKRHPSVKLYSHVHGSPALPMGNWTSADHDLEYVCTQEARLLCNTQASKVALEEAYPGLRVDAHVTGFPLVMERPAGWSRTPRHRIVVPGRLDFDRHPHVMYEALYPLAMDGWEIVFCTSDPLERSPYLMWLKRKKPEFVKVVTDLSMDGYFELLQSAWSVVVCGTADTLNLSAVQAHLLGVPVVAPDRPPYNEYLSWGLYQPFLLHTIRNLAQAGRYEPDGRAAELCDYRKVAQRYIDAMELA